MTPAPTTPDIHQATMTSAPTTPVSYPLQMEATASMQLSHLRGQRGRYASSDEQKHWQRQTSSLAKRSAIASIGVICLCLLHRRRSMLECPLPLLCHDQQVSRALRLHRHQMLCRKHPIPRCWNVVFKWFKGRRLCLQSGWRLLH